MIPMVNITRRFTNIKRVNLLVTCQNFIYNFYQLLNL